jgi:formylglycine-generating enzyme required for sulfatase activity
VKTIAIAAWCAVLGLASALIHAAPAPAKAPDIKRLHHAKDLAECTSCHTDGSFADIDLKQGCVACHEGEKGGRFRPAFENSRKFWDDDPSGRYGLHGEQYYPGTRIGADPNPMVLVPAGDFPMGTNERFSDEGPQHTVHLDAYYIDKYEVTNLQYEKFIDATHRKAPSHFTDRQVPQGKADHPVTFVTWYDARDYCAWAGKRLPNEAEWEKAARGTDARTFPWGNEFDIRKANTPVRWGRIGVEGDTTPVGAFPDGASPYGLQDMSGNVWEWTDSWYLAYPGNTDKSENYGEIYKVLRGGSWWDCSFYRCGISAPAYNRSFFNARVKNKTFGFRCAKNAG